MAPIDTTPGVALPSATELDTDLVSLNRVSSLLDPLTQSTSGLIDGSAASQSQVTPPGPSEPLAIVSEQPEVSPASSKANDGHPADLSGTTTGTPASGHKLDHHLAGSNPVPSNFKVPIDTSTDTENGLAQLLQQSVDTTRSEVVNGFALETAPMAVDDGEEVIHGNVMLVMQKEEIPEIDTHDRGYDRTIIPERIISRNGVGTRRMRSSSPKPKFEWKAVEDGSISCPPEHLEGSGKHHLELRCVFPGNEVMELVDQAEKIDEGYKILHASSGTCEESCSWIDPVDVVKCRKAACRGDSKDNYLFCPRAGSIQPEDFEHFRRHWLRCEPVIVRNTLQNGSGLSWEDDGDDPPDREHSEGNDGSENDVNQPVFNGNFQVSQLNGLSGDTVVYFNVHDLGANLEFDICSNKSSLVSEDMDSKKAVKIIKEHIMSCTRPPDECQLDDHRYEQLSFVTVEKEQFLKLEMVHKKIWGKRKSIHVGLASEGNTKELDSIAMEGLQLDSKMKMCFVDKLSEAQFWEWLILVTKMAVILHRAAFDKVGDPFSQSQSAQFRELAFDSQTLIVSDNATNWSLTSLSEKSTKGKSDLQAIQRVYESTLCGVLFCQNWLKGQVGCEHWPPDEEILIWYGPAEYLSDNRSCEEIKLDHFPVAKVPILAGPLIAGKDGSNFPMVRTCRDICIAKVRTLEHVFVHISLYVVVKLLEVISELVFTLPCSIVIFLAGSQVQQEAVLTTLQMALLLCQFTLTCVVKLREESFLYPDGPCVRYATSVYQKFHEDICIRKSQPKFLDDIGVSKLFFSRYYSGTLLFRVNGAVLIPIINMVEYAPIDMLFLATNSSVLYTPFHAFVRKLFPLSYTAAVQFLRPLLAHVSSLYDHRCVKNLMPNSTIQLVSMQCKKQGIEMRSGYENYCYQRSCYPFFLQFMITWFIENGFVAIDLEDLALVLYRFFSAAIQLPKALMLVLLSAIVPSLLMESVISSHLLHGLIREASGVFSTFLLCCLKPNSDLDGTAYQSTIEEYGVQVILLSPSTLEFHKASPRFLMLLVPTVHVILGDYDSSNTSVMICLDAAPCFPKHVMRASIVLVLCTEQATRHTLLVPKPVSTQVLYFHAPRKEFQLLHQGILEAQAIESDSYMNQVEVSMMHFQAPIFNGVACQCKTLLGKTLTTLLLLTHSWSPVDWCHLKGGVVDGVTLNNYSLLGSPLCSPTTEWPHHHVIQ